MFVRHLAKCSLLWMGLSRVRLKAKFFLASFCREMDTFPGDPAFTPIPSSHLYLPVMIFLW